MKNLLITIILILNTSVSEGASRFISTGASGEVNNEIYGINDLVSYTVNKDLNFTAIRFGGNNSSRYNYQTNSSNHANDWFYMNVAYEYKSGESYVDRLITQAIKNDSSLLITVPMIGWITKDRKDGWSYSVKKFGSQRSSEKDRSNGDAGNGVLSSGKIIYKTDLSQTSIRITPEFVATWVKHIKKKVAGRMDLYFALDNEPMLWHETHRDIRYSDPSLKDPKLGYDELWQRTVAYASAIKKVAPEAKLFGPVAWGWCSYNYSAKDGCRVGKDRLLHSNKAFLPWYLEKVCAHQKKTGLRLIDYLDIHYYPQYPYSSDDESSKAADLRMQAVRELYDESFVSQSWIKREINLIPRMKKIIKESCEGIKLAITEYRYGTSQNGRSNFLANTEALSVFAKYGVDFATMWSSLEKGSLVETSFKLYLDYDSQGANALDSRILRLKKLSGNKSTTAYGLTNKKKTLIYLFNKSKKSELSSISLKRECKEVTNYFVADKSYQIKKRGLKMIVIFK